MRRILALLCLALALTACGRKDDTAQDPDIVDAAAALPACSATWVVGKDLPEDYQGCRGKDNDPVVDKMVKCKDGRSFTTYEPRGMYAVHGKKIVALASGATTLTDPDYVAAFTDCTGDAPTAS